MSDRGLESGEIILTHRCSSSERRSSQISRIAASGMSVFSCKARLISASEAEGAYKSKMGDFIFEVVLSGGSIIDVDCCPGPTQA